MRAILARAITQRFNGGFLRVIRKNGSLKRSAMPEPPPACAVRAILIPALALLSGCVSTSIANDVPQCERLVPPGLATAVEGVAIPEGRLHADGHQDATPWIEGFVGQTGQLEIANGRAPAVDHIYRTCLTLHREALARSQRGFFGRLFGG